MKAEQTHSILHNNLFHISLATAGILMIPLLGRAPWTLGDFVLMGGLIFSTGLGINYGVKAVDKKYRLIAGAAILGVFFLIWAQLAVGLVGKVIVGSECMVQKGISVESFARCEAELRNRFQD